MERVKVLHIITHLGVGGALDNTLITIKGLSRDRYEVDLAAGILTGNYYELWQERAEACADKVILFRDLQRAPHAAKDKRVLQQLTDFIRERNYDIVHTHTAKAGVIGRIAAKRAGVATVVHTYHSFGWQDAHDFHAALWRRSLAHLKRRFYIRLERYAAGLSDALVTVSELNKKEALELEVGPAEKFVTIYSGVDLECFRDLTVDRNSVIRSFELSSERPIVGMIGRLSTQKAPLDFVQAAKIVLARRPDVQFILAGDGPLEAAVSRAIGAETRIKMLGFRNDVPKLLSILDIFVLTSLWEGLGRALTEAMIVGVPVAATSVDGIPELVSHRSTGMLSPPGNPHAMAENILWLLDHPKEAQEMSRSARKRVVPAFSAERMVEETDALYQRLLGQRSALLTV
ncbi:glycosyltransferase family 4 protein [candidate division KSB1 bacterium]|nr:glycosyltransferase family 4 protein [candidate division KSB1 bacterium]